MIARTTSANSDDHVIESYNFLSWSSELMYINAMMSQTRTNVPIVEPNTSIIRSYIGTALHSADLDPLLSKLLKKLVDISLI